MAFVWKDNGAFTLHLFAGLVCVILDSVVFAPSFLIYGAASFGIQSARRIGNSYQDEIGRREFKPSFLAPSWRWGWRGKFVAKIGVLSAWRLML